MTRARRHPAGLAAVWSLSLLIAAAPAAAQSRLEYSVKANYLVRFAAFVDWSPRAFSSPVAPVVICLVGRDPFAGGVEAAVRGQTAHGRLLTVRRPAPTALAGCHIVYVGQGGAAALTGAASPTGVLTVTDSAAGPERGAVHFVLSEGRVRFHIDQQAARRNGLTISSRLLNLALSVREG